MRNVLPKNIKLMISDETMRCCERILRYYVLNKPLSPDKFAHHRLLLFFRSEMEKNCFSPVDQNNLQEGADQAFSQFNETLTIKIHIAKLMKHHWQNNQMKMI